MAVLGAVSGPGCRAQGRTPRRRGLPRSRPLRRNTTIYARRPAESEARLLGQPVIVLQKADTGRDGRPIGYSESIWSAHRIQFSIDMLDDDEGAAR